MTNRSKSATGHGTCGRLQRSADGIISKKRCRPSNRNTPADVRQTANPKVLHGSMSLRCQLDDEST
jgi:hypothetical protein